MSITGGFIALQAVREVQERQFRTPEDHGRGEPVAPIHQGTPERRIPRLVSRIRNLVTRPA